MRSRRRLTVLALAFTFLVLSADEGQARGRRNKRCRTPRRQQCVPVCMPVCPAPTALATPAYAATSNCICPKRKMADFPGFCTYFADLCTFNPPFLVTFSHTQCNPELTPGDCGTAGSPCPPYCFPVGGPLLRTQRTYVHSDLDPAKETDLADKGIDPQSAVATPKLMPDVIEIGAEKYAKFKAPTGEFVFVKLYLHAVKECPEPFGNGFEVLEETLKDVGQRPELVTDVSGSLATQGARSAHIDHDGRTYLVITSTRVIKEKE